MKAMEIMEDVIGKEFMEGWHGMIDSCKAGDPQREVKKSPSVLPPRPRYCGRQQIGAPDC